MSDKRMVTCLDCGGDGLETCHNPDHNFVTALGGETSRLGCPVCGHDENHKVRNGDRCPTCNGKGEITEVQARLYCEENEIPYPED
jgi:DnaJ-class molecular chaperone